MVQLQNRKHITYFLPNLSPSGPPIKVPIAQETKTKPNEIGHLAPIIQIFNQIKGEVTRHTRHVKNFENIKIIKITTDITIVF
jgi:hypothetical protein